jgi:kinetochore protein Spc24
LSTSSVKADLTLQLISQCTSHFKISNDTASLMRISDSLSTLSSFRTQHLSTLQTSLSQLSRMHHTLSANHSHTVSQHNAVDHASEILRLDTEKFKIAKQASDLEIEGERLQQEMGRLGNVAGDLDEEGVEGGLVERPGDDATV